MSRKLRTVMLVDDDPALNWISTKIIELGGYADRIIDFTNPLDGIEYLKSNSREGSQLPCVLFLDINMPYMNGWDFLTELKIISPELPKTTLIYILTSSDFNEDVEKSKSFTELSGYFVKPLAPEYFEKVFSELDAKQPGWDK